MFSLVHIIRHLCFKFIFFSRLKYLDTYPHILILNNWANSTCTYYLVLELKKNKQRSWIQRFQNCIPSAILFNSFPWEIKIWILHLCLRAFDTVMFCLCLTHVWHSILDVGFAKHTNWYWWSDNNSKNRFSFVIESTSIRLFHIFHIWF